MTALGWASTLLFGRVPAKRQYLLLGITFGSVIWIVLLAGVLFPDVGTFLLLFIPDQDIVPEAVIRLIMLIGALIVPGIIGALTLTLSNPDGASPKRAVEGVARGYPLTVLLSVLLIFLAGLAIFRKAQSLARGWTDAHVPLVIEPGKYDDVAADLDRALYYRRPRGHTDDGARGDVEARAMAGRGGWHRGPLAGPREAHPARRGGPRHPHLPDGPAGLGQAGPRGARSGRDGQPPDDLGRAPHDQRGGTGDRRSAGRPGPTVGRRLRIGHDGSTTPRRPSSPPSTSSSPRSRSRTRSGRCSTDSASRSSGTCVPGRWPATPWSERRRRVSPTKACSARWRISAAWCDRGRRQCWRRPRTASRRGDRSDGRLGVALGGTGRVRRGHGGAGGDARAGKTATKRGMARTRPRRRGRRRRSRRRIQRRGRPLRSPRRPRKVAGAADPSPRQRRFAA